MPEPRVSDKQLALVSGGLAGYVQKGLRYAWSLDDGGVDLLDVLLDLRDARARIAALVDERDEARAHVRNHHLEACESCVATESERDAARAELDGERFLRADAQQVIAELVAERDALRIEHAALVRALADVREHSTIGLRQWGGGPCGHPDGPPATAAECDDPEVCGLLQRVWSVLSLPLAEAVLRGEEAGRG